MADVKKNDEDGPKRNPLTTIASWAEARGETATALAVAIAATIYAALGKVDTVEKLAPLLLTVLVVMALAMVIERERRIKESDRLGGMAKDIGRTAEGIEILGTPTPYHVVLSESIWEIEGNGDAHTTRLKKLRFTQDDVIAVVDWYRGEGTLTGIDRLAAKRSRSRTRP